MAINSKSSPLPSTTPPEATPFMSYQEAVDRIPLYDSHFDVLEYLMEDVFPRQPPGEPKLRYQDWLRLLGEYWSSFGSVTCYTERLREILPTVGPVRTMMTVEENAAYDALPIMVTIYRGCDAGSKLGPCWSLNREVANRFPFLALYEAKVPTLVTACVRKSRVLAIKLDGEEEIIAFEVLVEKVESVSPIPTGKSVGEILVHGTSQTIREGNSGVVKKS